VNEKPKRKTLINTWRRKRDKSVWEFLQN